MKTLFDSSVLVAALVAPHPMHAIALPWLQRAPAGEFEWFVSTTTLAETYAVFTATPFKPRISPATARTLIDHNIRPSAIVVALDEADYIETLDRIANFGLVGGIVYDALIARAAAKVGVARLFTFNVKDFVRVWPEGVSVIQAPP